MGSKWMNRGRKEDEGMEGEEREGENKGEGRR